jgi:hypothetical protein
MEKITQKSFDNILKKQLSKGLDVDSVLDWMEKTFEVVSDEQYVEEQLEIARSRGYLATMN